MKKLHILLAEDSGDDVFIIKRAIKSRSDDTIISTVRDGAAAIEYLEENEPPDLIVLDLNLPKIDGFLVLDLLRRNQVWKSIPVIVCSGSCEPVHIKNAYGFGANVYVTKSVNVETFKLKLNAVLQLFFSVIEFPLIKNPAEPLPG